MVAAREELNESPELAGRSSETSGAALRRGVFLTASMTALLAGFLATDPQTAARAAAADVELTTLLRAMTGLKAVAVAALLAAVAWRFRAAASMRRLALYTATGCLAAAGIGLMWHIAHTVTGAAMLHGGLIAGAVLLWRDPATARLLDKRWRRFRRQRRDSGSRSDGDARQRP